MSTFKFTGKQEGLYFGTLTIIFFTLNLPWIYLQRCSFLFYRSLVFSISALKIFSHHASVAPVSINPFFKFLVFFLSGVVSSKASHELRMLPADQSKWSLSRQPALCNSKCLLLWKRRYKKSQISKRPHHMHINGSKWWIKTKDSQISQEGDERYENILDIFLNIFFRSLIHSQKLIFGSESLPVMLNFQEMRITFRENSTRFSCGKVLK